MITSRRVRLGRPFAASAFAVGVGAALALGGCSSGQLAQTAKDVAAVPGANVDAGPIALRDVLLAYSGPEGYPAGANAALQVRIFNQGTKTVKLVGATSPDAAAVILAGGALASPSPISAASPSAASPSTAASGSASAPPAASASAAATPSAAPAPAAQPLSIAIPAQSYVILVPGQGAYLQLTGLKRSIAPGESVAVTFTFDDGTSVPVRIPFAPPLTPLPRPSPTINEGGTE